MGFLPKNIYQRLFHRGFFPFDALSDTLEFLGYELIQVLVLNGISV